MKEASLLKGSCRLQKHSCSEQRKSYHSKCRLQPMTAQKLWKALPHPRDCLWMKGAMRGHLSGSACSSSETKVASSLFPPKERMKWKSAWRSEDITHWYFGWLWFIPPSRQLFSNTPQNNTLWYSLQKGKLRHSWLCFRLFRGWQRWEQKHCTLDQSTSSTRL